MPLTWLVDTGPAATVVSVDGAPDTASVRALRTGLTTRVARRPAPLLISLAAPATTEPWLFPLITALSGRSGTPPVPIAVQSEGIDVRPAQVPLSRALRAARAVLLDGSAQSRTHEERPPDDDAPGRPGTPLDQRNRRVLGLPAARPGHHHLGGPGRWHAQPPAVAPHPAADPPGPMTPATRIYVDMVGDLFHPGHVALLKAARHHGDHLIAGVLSDETVASYKRRPIMTLAERVAVIAACRYVDEVLPAAPYRVTLEFLDEHDIALVVHGDDITPEAVDEVYGPVAAAGRLRLVHYTAGVSTTDLIARVRARPA